MLREGRIEGLRLLRCVSFGSFVRDYQLLVLYSLSIRSCSSPNVSPTNQLQSQSQPQSLSLSQKPTHKRIHHRKRASFLKTGTRSFLKKFPGATRVIIVCLETWPVFDPPDPSPSCPHQLMPARLHRHHSQSAPPISTPTKHILHRSLNIISSKAK